MADPVGRLHKYLVATLSIPPRVAKSSAPGQQDVWVIRICLLCKRRRSSQEGLTPYNPRMAEPLLREIEQTADLGIEVEADSAGELFRRAGLAGRRLGRSAARLALALARLFFASA